MTTVGSDALRGQMKARTDAELVRICTLEAGDYTQDAVAVAREELASRGQDVTTLVASAPAERPADPRKGGGTLVVLGLALAVFSAPWSDELPRALLIALEAAAASLVMMGAFRAFAS